MTEPEERIYYLRGIPAPETPDPGKELKPWKETQVIGEPLPRIDAHERVTGSAVFPSDVTLPGMLYGAILTSPHPNALIKHVDTGDAEKLPGVRSIITGATPGADLHWRYGSVKRKFFDEHCAYEGEVIAAVAAETPYQAWDSVRAIRVKYQVLPFVVDERQALASNAVRVHGGSNIVDEPQKYERGDVEKGFSEADVVLERTYRTECELHTPMELHGCVARWDDDRLTIWESTQGVYAVQSLVAETLEMPLSKVRVIGHYVGGGFGSKLQASKYTVIAALLAGKTNRPVKLFLSREQTLLCVGNRPPANMKLKAGVKKDGTLTALQFTCSATGGAFPSGGIALIDWQVRDLYTCPNVRCECTDVYIHAGPARWFRAPGHPQTSWALEQMIDELAEATKIDPVDLRLKNIPTFSQARSGSPAYTSTGLKECLERGAKAFGWKSPKESKPGGQDAPHIKRGVGMAACLWYAGGGRPPSTIVLKLFADGSANLNMGASDIGTGTKTVAAMVVSEELGLKTANIQIENADTGTTQYASPSGGSKTIPTEMPAVRDAAVNVKRQLLKLAADDLKSDPHKLLISNGKVFVTDDPEKSVKIRQISGLKTRGVIVGIGYRGPNPKDKVVNPFGAQFCELKVNTLTGEVEILRFVASHDSGRVMNRLTYDSQVVGGITMGIGFAMSESRILDRNETGKMCNRSWHDYKLPTALDVPLSIETLPIDPGDQECNSTGAKGLGEPVTIPTAAAIANAVYAATGVRVFNGPITPMRLCELLADMKKKG
jgi:CO/xanthine dehydrogenase Mo-binding subunit